MFRLSKCPKSSKKIRKWKKIFELLMDRQNHSQKSDDPKEENNEVF